MTLLSIRIWNGSWRLHSFESLKLVSKILSLLYHLFAILSHLFLQFSFALSFVFNYCLLLFKSLNFRMNRFEFVLILRTLPLKNII
jgi:hypothetical protein